jgi:hypothetical protein
MSDKHKVPKELLTRGRTVQPRVLAQMVPRNSEQAGRTVQPRLLRPAPQNDKKD